MNSKPATVRPWVVRLPRIIAWITITMALMSPSLVLAAEALSLQPIYEVTQTNHTRILIDQATLKHASKPWLKTNVAFHAVVSQQWPLQLVPLFGVERRGQWSLQRRPRPGRENITEAFCFALPPRDEPEAARLAGRWDCRGLHADGAKEFFGWDLTLETNQVSGRFDPDTDYRFAYITGGTFSNNLFQLNITYISNHYTVTGRWSRGTMSGGWIQLGDSGRGTWTAQRPKRWPTPASRFKGFDLVPLHRWVHSSSGARRFLPATTVLKPEWKRDERPMARVWIARTDERP